MANFSKSDLEFILKQIFIAEAHADGASLSDLLPNSQVPFGLRTVDGSFNNLVAGQSEFGAADNSFLRLLDAPTVPTTWAPATSSIRNRAPSAT